MRVALHPASDAFARGAHYGDVTVATLDLCIDCTLTVAGYDSHEMGRIVPLAVREWAASAGLVSRVHVDGEPLSWEPCDGCQSATPGERFPHTQYS